ncbi:TLC domain protein [Ceratobasidium sp. AG-Ba]|nr:TLC domain protein [Ceratobasidium sp. AG-Ba]
MPGADEATARNGTARKKQLATPEPSIVGQYWEDITTLNWTRYPGSSFRLMILPILLWFNWHIIGSSPKNPFSPLLFISNPVKTTPTGQVQYAKSYADLAFIGYYIVVFSFIRQFTHAYVLHPLARRLGLYGSKEERFVEQAYSFLYYGSMGIFGLFVMRELPTWWYKTEHFWLEYPHWEMNKLMKTYYLLQTAYWTQQLFVLVLKIEKPRKDYTELVIHHVVTIWLIGWSYLINLTWIGNAVFVTMDWSDVFLALAKMLNYLDMEISKSIAFTWFALVWTYTRHYLNLRIIWSVWHEFWLIRPENQMWDTARGVWLAPWMRYQVFAPLVALQAVNLFWYWNIWRIIITTIVFKKDLDDDRSEHGDDDTKEE